MATGSTTTRFMRHESLLRFIVERVAARKDDQQTTRIHVAGCSEGMEPISLAIALAGAALSDDVEILATDYNPDMIERADAGLFPADSIARLPATLRDDHFEETEDGAFRYRGETAAPIRFLELDLRETPDDRLSADIVLANNIFPRIEDHITPDEAKAIASSVIKLRADDQAWVIMFGEKPAHVVQSLRQAGLKPAANGLLPSLVADEIARKVWSISDVDEMLAKPDWLWTYGAVFGAPDMVDSLPPAESLAGFNPELIAATERAISLLSSRADANSRHVAICDPVPSVGGLRAFDAVGRIGGALKRTYHAGGYELDDDYRWRVPYSVVNALPAKTRLRLFDHDRPREGVHPTRQTLEGWTLSLGGTDCDDHPAIDAESFSKLDDMARRLFGPRNAFGRYPYKSSVDYGPISRLLVGQKLLPKPDALYLPVFADGDIAEVRAEAAPETVEAEPRRYDFFPKGAVIEFDEDIEAIEISDEPSDPEALTHRKSLTLDEASFSKLPREMRNAPFLKASANFDRFTVIGRADLPEVPPLDADQSAPDLDLLIFTESLFAATADTRKAYVEAWARRLKPGGLCILFNDGDASDLTEALRNQELFAVTGGTLADPERIWSGSPSRMGRPYPSTITDRVAAHWLFARTDDRPLIEYGDRLEPLIAKAEGVSLSFPRHFRRAKSEDGKRFQALDDISFDIRHGEILGIIGRNGAGKSTLLKLLAEVFRPDSGALWIDGRSRLAALGLGLNLDLSGRDNIDQMCAFLGLSRAQRKAAEIDVIEFTQLGEFIDMPVRYYSSGMRARLSFAITTVEAPDLLLLDEVFATGDRDFAKASKERLNGVLASAGAVVIVSHQLGVLRSLANRVMWIERGKLQAIGHPDEVVEAYLDSNRYGDDDPDTDGPAPTGKGETAASSPDRIRPAANGADNARAGLSGQARQAAG